LNPEQNVFPHWISSDIDVPMFYDRPKKYLMLFQPVADFKHVPYFK